MAFTENFDTDTGNYTIDPSWATYEAALGNSSPGCVRLNVDTVGIGTGELTNAIDSQTVSSGDHFYFNYNVFNGPGGAAEIRIALEFLAGTDTYIITPSGNTGWVQFSQDISGRAGDDLISVDISLAKIFLDPTDWYVLIDSIKAGAPPPPTLSGGASTPDRRYLGIDADFGHIYLTSITGGSVTYNSVPIGGTAFDGTATFGTAAYTDPDSFTKGLYPVIRPGTDSVLYLRGRDGNSKQAWYNDLSGTLGFVDIGPGSATWGTAKFAVALMPDQLNPFDVIVAFSDNDIYRTEEGTTNWVKQGDAPSGLRCAARLTGTAGFETFLAGGTAAGTAWFTQNMGVSFTGGGTAAGTINAIEVSR